LQIDIDGEIDYSHFLKASEILLPAMRYNEVLVSESKSGMPHRHITITLNKAMDVWQRIALQLCFGSHITRETLNSYRVLIGNECPIVFFEKDKKDQRHIRLIRVNPNEECL